MDGERLPFETEREKILVEKKKECESKHGKVPEERTIEELLKSSIILVDKPSGPTSHQVVDYVKRILNIKKAGHSGTLDPGVTGVLPVALQEGTRITNSLLNAGKEYVCLMHLHEDYEKDKILGVLEEFTGKISQLPPKKSAVKRQQRYRNVYYIELLEVEGRDVLFRVGCEAGTYIRKLVHDIGLKLGSGAHMAELRRTKAGPFTEEKSVTLHDLADAYHYYKEGNETPLREMLLPLEEGVSHLKKIWVHDATVDSLCHGAFLKVPGVCSLETGIEKGETVCVMTLKGELVLVGEALMDSMDMKNFDKGIAVRTKQVFMKPGTYPKYNPEKN